MTVCKHSQQQQPPSAVQLTEKHCLEAQALTWDCRSLLFGHACLSEPRGMQGLGCPPNPPSPPAPSAPQVPAGPGWCVELPCPSPSPGDLCFYHHHKQRHRHSNNLTNFCESVMSL